MKSSARQVDGPHQRLGMEQRLARAVKQEKQRGNGQWIASRRECYLRFLCIVFSQEDGHPRVSEANSGCSMYIIEAARMNQSHGTVGLGP